MISNRELCKGQLTDTLLAEATNIELQRALEGLSTMLLINGCDSMAMVKRYERIKREAEAR